VWLATEWANQATIDAAHNLLSAKNAEKVTAAMGGVIGLDTDNYNQKLVDGGVLDAAAVHQGSVVDAEGGVRVGADADRCNYKELSVPGFQLFDAMFLVAKVTVTRVGLELEGEALFTALVTAGESAADLAKDLTGELVDATPTPDPTRAQMGVQTAAERSTSVPVCGKGKLTYPCDMYDSPVSGKLTFHTHYPEKYARAESEYLIINAQPLPDTTVAQMEAEMFAEEELFAPTGSKIETPVEQYEKKRPRVHFSKVGVAKIRGGKEKGGTVALTLDEGAVRWPGGGK
jgi:hypothetical protein